MSVATGMSLAGGMQLFDKTKTLQEFETQSGHRYAISRDRDGKLGFNEIVRDNEKELRYQDTRKFGRMYLFKKDTLFHELPLSEIGKEPWDEELTEAYLKDKLKDKRIPIKTSLLDQTIIAGIGNIYADEILFLSGIHPLKSSCKLTKKNRQDIIDSTREILGSAIKMGGTTIRSYESDKGVHGRFQQNLLVHTLTTCSKCNGKVEKIVVGGRGTYFCKNCQKYR